MNKTTFELGDWRVDLLDGGGLSLDGGAMFGSVPRVLWERLIPPDEAHRIPLAMRLLVARNEKLGHRVLVDTGIGEKFDDRFESLFAIRRSPVVESLAAIGLETGDITHVILTHLHFDHAGGVSRRDGESIVPSFPAATHVLQRANLDEARSPNPRERASYLEENWKPLEDVRLELLDGTAEVLPGLRVDRSDGHTRGMQTLHIEGGGRVLFYPADLCPTSHHANLAYTMGYDLCPRTILEEKEAAWKRVLEEEAIVVFEHDPVVSFGRLSIERGKYRVMTQVDDRPTSR